MILRTKLPTASTSGRIFWNHTRPDHINPTLTPNVTGNNPDPNPNVTSQVAVDYHGGWRALKETLMSQMRYAVCVVRCGNTVTQELMYANVIWPGMISN